MGERAGLFIGEGSGEAAEGRERKNKNRISISIRVTSLWLMEHGELWGGA